MSRQSKWVPQRWRQGDILSPALFNIFLNDLAKEIKMSNVEMKFGDQLLSILLYADDNVILVYSEGDIQKLLDITFSWCMK